MKTILIKLTVWLVLLCTPVIHSIKSDIKLGNEYKINKIDSLVQKLVSDKKTAGFAYGIQIGNSKPITKEYGFADLEEDRVVKPTDQFRIASITKPFTATAIFKLMEQKKLSLDDKINKFFPDFPNGNNITIYQLLSHTSGIPNWWEGEMQGDVPGNFPMCKAPHKYLQSMKKSSLFEPGEFYSYSNSGYVLLGEIIEIASGKTYDTFLENNIFKPAGITNTEVEYIEEPSENWVKGYALNEKLDMPFTNPEVYNMPFSAGALRSDAKDLMKFINALYSGKIISNDLLREMTSYAKLKNGKPVYEGKYTAPGFKKRKPKEYRKKTGYGLGFSMMELYNTPVIWHSGGIAGFNSILMYLPEDNTTLVLLANTENGIIPQWEEIQKIITEE